MNSDISKQPEAELESEPVTVAGVATISLPSECEPPAPRRSSRQRTSLEAHELAPAGIPSSNEVVSSCVNGDKNVTKQSNKRKSSEPAIEVVPPIPDVIEGSVSVLAIAPVDEPEAKKVCCQMDLSRTVPRKTADPVNCSDIIHRMYKNYYALEVTFVSTYFICLLLV